MCTTYNNHKHKISKPDKLNCSQPSTADNHNNWRAWIVAGILHCSPPMWNQRLKVRCRRMCHVITNGKVLFWLKYNKYTQTQTQNFLHEKTTNSLLPTNIIFVFNNRLHLTIAIKLSLTIPRLKLLQCFDAVGWAAGRASGL